MSGQAKFRFLFVSAFSLPKDGRFEGPKQTGQVFKKELPNFQNFSHLLEDVEWEAHEGPLAPYGDWTVENREEFAAVTPGRLRIVREACESGKYNAIILEGGGEPGFMEAREITRKYGIVVTSCAFSQFHVASMLGYKFSVIDYSDVHTVRYRDLVISHGFTDRCASIRNVGYFHPKPEYPGEPSFREGKYQAERGERSEVVDKAVAEAVDAIENDGAEVITLGCSATFWLRPFLQQRLDALGWEVPVLDGYSCAIEVAKTMLNLRVNVSGLSYPRDRPKKRARRTESSALRARSRALPPV